jgi:PAS domain S-box-containing protein
MFGYKADEAIGRHITLIIPPDRQDEEQEILRRMRNGERVDHFETVRARKDGTVLNIAATISPIKDAAGHVIGASKVARDITERLQAERALVEQARLLDLTNDAILVRDSDDRITYWNKGASELYGFSRDEALGRVSHELLRTAFPEPIESIREELNRENRWTGEVIHNCKEGSQITVLSRWVLDRDQYGSPQGVLETNNDITEQKRAEEALRQSEEVLRALSQSLEFQIQARTTELEQRNEEVLQRSEQLRRLWNRLVRTQEEERRHIARELHDSLGQYLAALSMVLESAKQETPASQKLKEAVQIVQTCIMDVRTVSHLLHPPLLEEAGLASAAKWYIEGFAQRSGILAGVEIDETVGRLPEDIELGLFRVLQESLTNVHRHSGSKTVAVRIGADAQQVWLDIQDQGKGMPGLGRPGVGITSMRERVENLAGEFLVTSDQNGTRVRVVLPLASASRSSAAAS